MGQIAPKLAKKAKTIYKGLQGQTRQFFQLIWHHCYEFYLTRLKILSRPKAPKILQELLSNSEEFPSPRQTKLLKNSKRFQKIPEDSKRFLKIPKDSERFQKNPKDSKKIQKIQKDSKDFKRFQKILKESKRILKILKRFQKIPKDSKRIQ